MAGSRSRVSRASYMCLPPYRSPVAPGRRAVGRWPARYPCGWRSLRSGERAASSAGCCAPCWTSSSLHGTLPRRWSSSANAKLSSMHRGRRFLTVRTISSSSVFSIRAALTTAQEIRLMQTWGLDRRIAWDRSIGTQSMSWPPRLERRPSSTGTSLWYTSAKSLSDFRPWSVPAPESRTGSLTLGRARLGPSESLVPRNRLGHQSGCSMARTAVSLAPAGPPSDLSCLRFPGAFRAPGWPLPRPLPRRCALAWERKPLRTLSRRSERSGRA